MITKVTYKLAVDSFLLRTFHEFLDLDGKSK